MGVAPALCAACGGTRFSSTAYPGSAPAGASLHFDSIRLCSDCGLGEALPRHTQAQLDALYAGGGYWHKHGGNAALSAHARNQCRHRVRRALMAIDRARVLRVLDIGAGEAWIGEALAPAAYDYVEPDPRQRERSARRLGARARGFASLEGLDGAYELVFVNQVLEHVADPAAFLSAAAARLAPGGMLYVEVPNADYRFKADVYPHTLFFTTAALARLAERAGLKTVACESFGSLPEKRPASSRLAGKAALQVGAALALAPLANAGDDLLFSYAGNPDGIWLRWLGGRST